MRIFSRTGIIVIIFLSHSLAGLCQQNTISIAITNIRSDLGVVRLAVYDHPNQFPDDPVKGFTYEKTLLKDGNLEVVLNDFPPGSYAISILDDEDEDEEMNLNILRMPREGYGFSNNARPVRKRPPFEECSFHIAEGKTNLHIEMQYFRE